MDKFWLKRVLLVLSRASLRFDASMVLLRQATDILINVLIIHILNVFIALVHDSGCKSFKGLLTSFAAPNRSRESPILPASLRRLASSTERDPNALISLGAIFEEFALSIGLVDICNDDVALLHFHELRVSLLVNH